MAFKQPGAHIHDVTHSERSDIPNLLARYFWTVRITIRGSVVDITCVWGGGRGHDQAVAHGPRLVDPVAELLSDMTAAGREPAESMVVLGRTKDILRKLFHGKDCYQFVLSPVRSLGALASPIAWVAGAPVGHRQRFPIARISGVKIPRCDW